MKLKNKMAIVTGGAQGIGKAIGMRLAKDGANIGILDIQIDEAMKTADEIRKAGVGATTIQCDVTDYNSVKTAVEKIHGVYGALHIRV